jgi:rRNA-processing protein FCF1
MKIILDTSSLEYGEKEKKDYLTLLEQFTDEKIELFITDGVINELERHSSEKTIRGKNSKVVLLRINKLIEQKRLKRIVEPLSNTNIVDDALIKEALKLNGVILTQDKMLKLKAKEQGIRTITYKRSGIIGD